MKNNHYYSSIETTNEIWANRQFRTALTPLTLPVIAPPLPDVVGFKCTHWLGLEIVRPLVHHIDISRAKENDDRELRQVD